MTCDFQNTSLSEIIKIAAGRDESRPSSKNIRAAKSELKRIYNNIQPYKNFPDFLNNINLSQFEKKFWELPKIPNTHDVFNCSPQPLEFKLWIDIHLHVFIAREDDGSNACHVNERNIEMWVRFANDLFHGMRIRIGFDPNKDVEFFDHSNTNNASVVQFEQDIKNGQTTSPDIDAILKLHELGRKFPKKMVAVCRRGRNDSLGQGYSSYANPAGPHGVPKLDDDVNNPHFQYNHVVLPEYDPFFVSIFAHEVGHYLGLHHVIDPDNNNHNFMRYGSHHVNGVSSNGIPILPQTITIHPGQEQRMLDVVAERAAFGLSI
jgi:hypothetical protein